MKSEDHNLCQIYENLLAKDERINFDFALQSYEHGDKRGFSNSRVEQEFWMYIFAQHLALKMSFWESNSTFQFFFASLSIFLNSRLWKLMGCHLFPSFGGIWFFVAHSNCSNDNNNSHKNMMNTTDTHEYASFCTPLFQLFRKQVSKSHSCALNSTIKIIQQNACS